MGEKASEKEGDKKVGKIDQIKGPLYDNLGKIVLILLALTLLWHWGFSLDAQSFTAGPGHLDLQLAWQKAEFVDIVKGWEDPAGSIAIAVQRYQQHLIKLDFLFPLYYVLTLGFLIAWVTQVPRKDLHRWFWGPFLLVVLGCLFDYAENYLHITTLQGVTSAADLEKISAVQIFLMSLLVTGPKYLFLLSGLVLAVAVRVRDSYYKMDKQTLSPEQVKKLSAEIYAQQPDEHLPEAVIRAEEEELGKRRQQATRDADIGAKLEERCDVAKKELEKLEERLRQAAQDVVEAETEEQRADAAAELKELEKQRADVAAEREWLEKCKLLLAHLRTPAREQGGTPGRRPIGLAFSGGGIRSACFNLGLVQGLAKHGFLPWVDYLTSVSGGGLTAACMMTLLSNKDGDSAKHHFNTRWDRFPFNPGLEVFDAKGVAYESGATSGPLKRGINKQLKYLREQAYYLMPYRGLFTRDNLRMLGAILVRTSYTLFIFLMALVAFSAFYYGLMATFTPSIILDISPEAYNSFDLIFGNGEPDSIPRLHYLVALAAGFGFSLLIGEVLASLYKKHEPGDNRQETGDNRIASTLSLLGKKSRFLARFVPGQDTSDRDLIPPEIRLGIFRWRLFVAISFIGLYIATLGLALMHCRALLQPTAGPFNPDWGWTLLLMAPISLLILYRFFKTSADDRWIKQGRLGQLQIDTLVIFTIMGFHLWLMILLIAWLKFLWHSTNPQIFWLWLPVLFTLGGLLGLLVARVLSPTQYVYRSKEGQIYSRDGIGWDQAFVQQSLKATSGATAPKDDDGARSRWSNSRFRSIFWTLQGLVLFELIAFLLMALLMLPHYFQWGDADSIQVPLPVVVSAISAIFGTILASGGGKGSKSKNLLVRAITLPAELRDYVLGALVIVFNLSIIFVIQILIDNLHMGAPQVYGIGIATLVVFYIGGRITNFNYLAHHYFTRDRLAEVFMRTDVAAKDGGIETPRDDSAKFLSRITTDDCSAPYHIVVTALGLSGSWYLEVKDRKSQPFILSKRYCGSKITGYVKTDKYRNGLTKYARAIALSAAPLSPSLGHHTFLAQAFMTTLINARLGLWAISPEQYKPDVLSKYAKPEQRESRVFWPRYLWDEATAAVSERRPLINLTDGEHTGDNIGLYPLFQRRCKVIIAGDASDDIKGHCEALFYVLHQVKVDLNIHVDIDVSGLKPTDHDEETGEFGPCKRHVAVGRIHYPDPDQHGWLIYFKPTVTCCDPGTIQGYWEKHQADFPHRTTLDQFFDEKEFEAYRYLGEWTVDHLIKDLLERLEECCQDLNLLDLQGKIKEQLQDEHVDLDCVLYDGLLQLDKGQSEGILKALLEDDLPKAQTTEHPFDQFVDKLMVMLRAITKLPDDDQGQTEEKK